MAPQASTAIALIFLLRFSTCNADGDLRHVALSHDSTDIIDIGSTQEADYQSALKRIKPSTSAEHQQEAVTDLIKRLIPARAADFRVFIVPPVNGQEKDNVTVVSSDGTVNITASSGVAASYGFHYYLKKFCKCHISWDGNQLNLPELLPPASIALKASDRFRYFGNVCTASYSWVWWDWFEWEKQIDWMAMNGITLPLAPTAQEVIWIKIYLELGMTSEEIEEHIAGPPFLAWGRMGNIRGWGGPISIDSQWYTDKLELQHKILNRMRSLGMIPVLPAFAGHVPRAFQRLYPDANFTKMSIWNFFPDQYCCPLLLDPTSELFQETGKMFITEIMKEFGTDHMYSADPFNEMRPSSNNTDYISAISRSIFTSMSEVDKDAIWVLQNWMFVNDKNFWTKEVAKTFLTAVPIGRILVLDLQSELKEQYTNLDSYFGQPYIWNMLHNYGGTLGLYGAIDRVNQLVYESRTRENSTMMGIGLTPEGIGQNYVMYDFMMETGWNTEPVDLTQWFTDYSIRRYGISDERAIAAWQLLKVSTYNYTGATALHGRYFYIMRPNLKSRPTIWYNANQLIQAWNKLVNMAQNVSKENQLFKHDLIDVTREASGLFALYHYTLMVKSFKTNNSVEFMDNASQLLNLLGDMELILASGENFLVGKWLESAKSAATSLQERHLLEQNARNQITLWGPNGEILDYAGKQWSGIVSHYFKPRWMLFIQKLNESLTTGSYFDQAKFNEQVFFDVEQKFTLDNNEFPVDPQGDALEIAIEIHKKWQPIYKKRFHQYMRKLKRHFYQKQQFKLNKLQEL
ncbi:alpha-N-acetylglucosaminidase [Ischnura elegans]|uniref:alpha-N-acetylglucosaminidase n=1 Tax=Ischnura elegans TaxID=197161 RepID=UPI001ED8AC78|nr:alpha-N-acetylglucosaminidase [Ischnura elegans]